MDSEVRRHVALCASDTLPRREEDEADHYRIDRKEDPRPRRSARGHDNFGRITGDRTECEQENERCCDQR